MSPSGTARSGAEDPDESAATQSSRPSAKIANCSAQWPSPSARATTATPPSLRSCRRSCSLLLPKPRADTPTSAAPPRKKPSSTARALPTSAHAALRLAASFFATQASSAACRPWPATSAGDRWNGGRSSSSAPWTQGVVDISETGATSGGARSSSSSSSSPDSSPSSPPPATSPPGDGGGDAADASRSTSASASAAAASASSVTTSSRTASHAASRSAASRSSSESDDPSSSKSRSAASRDPGVVVSSPGQRFVGVSKAMSSSNSPTDRTSTSMSKASSGPLGIWGEPGAEDTEPSGLLDRRGPRDNPSRMRRSGRAPAAASPTFFAAFFSVARSFLAVCLTAAPTPRAAAAARRDSSSSRARRCDSRRRRLRAGASAAPPGPAARTAASRLSADASSSAVRSRATYATAVGSSLGAARASAATTT
mmetsp:Transcript_24509/g.76608  ORF Transcript_24509/g.76608 Transcript_24509/m.76608 type:complete len:427 (+) Transcript_24509:225-1505(+)